MLLAWSAWVIVQMTGSGSWISLVFRPAVTWTDQDTTQTEQTIRQAVNLISMQSIIKKDMDMYYSIMCIISPMGVLIRATTRADLVFLKLYLIKTRQSKTFTDVIHAFQSAGNLVLYWNHCYVLSRNQHLNPWWQVKCMLWNDCLGSKWHFK